MAKKYKLFKVAKELNVASDTIKAFLEKKGLQVKGPNTSISNEDYQEILDKFSIEKERADMLHARKEQEKEEETLANAEVGIDEGDVAVSQGEKITTPDEEKTEAVSRTFLEEKLEMIEKDKIERVKKRKSKIEEAKQKKEEKKEQEAAEAAGKKAGDDKKPAKETQTADKAVKVKTEKEAEEKKGDKESRKKKKISETPKSDKEEDKQSKKQSGKRKPFDKQRFAEKRRRKKVDLLSIADGEAEAPKRRRKRRKKQAVDQAEVDNTLKKTLAQMGSSTTRKKKKKVKHAETGEIQEIEQSIISVTEFISAQDLAGLMDIPIQDVIKKAIEIGLMITINQRLDMDTIAMLADEFDFAVEEEEEYHAEIALEQEEEEDKPEDLKPRPPVVTIMGHVDHGKTSLLDHIRKANVVDSEAGGITQHIGAYQVDYNDRIISFLDTPGHEAFTAMRARGAKVTDLAIIVIAADDAVMPQTVEAIDHAKSAEVPMVFAINKMDKSGANPDKIFQQLADRNILVEDWGGTFQVAKISAKKGEGIDELLEKVILEADMLELKANPSKPARGVIIEARLDKGKGAIATVLVQSGTLHIGDSFVAGYHSGKVRALFDENIKSTREAGPSVPVQVIGFAETPQAGDLFTVMKDERSARELGNKRQQIKREQDFRKHHHLTLDDISKRIEFGELKELNIIVKADVDGSVEALSDSLMKMSNDEVAVHVVRKAVGQISEADVMLAAASQAFIIGFHVRPSAKARELAAQEKVDIRTYKVVYDAINEIKLALEGMLSPEVKEQIMGHLEIRQVFKISKIGTIGGCYATDGKIIRANPIRLIRDGIVIYEGNLSSLKRFNDDVHEVKSGFECGLQIAGYNDIRVGDEIESFETFEEKRKLQ